MIESSNRPRKCGHRLSSDAGFTLIEVMIAAIVLSITVVGFVASHASVVRANRTSRELRAATLLAQNQIARLQRDAMEWTGSASSTGTMGPELSAAVVAGGTTTPAPINGLGLPAEGNGGFGSGALFCVHSEVVNDTSGMGAPQDVLRATVGVYWAASGNVLDADDNDMIAGCSVPLPADDARVHYIQLEDYVPWYR